MTVLRQWVMAAACLLAVAGAASAQETDPAADGAQPIRMFLDCNGFFCQQDYFQTEIQFVDHVRNRQDADVHVLVTRQPTGGGGFEYTTTFLDQRDADNPGEVVLRHVVPPASSEDAIRRELARTIKLGLVPLVSGTETGRRLQVTFDAAPARGAAAATPARDPWNRWTFRSQVNGSFNGESRSASRSVFGNVSASRVTEEWKLQVSANGNERRNRFKLNDTTRVTARQHGYGMGGLVVRSLSGHLSAGARAGISSSTFLNQDLRIRFAPAVEYNYFPYSESTRRQLTTQYSLGANSFDYREKTVFGKVSDRLIDHSFVTALDLKQRWGSVNVTGEATQYLNDPKRYSAELFNELDVQLIKGLSLNLFSSVSYVRNQIHLPAGNASPEQVLLRLRQLQSSYFYSASIGASYTFGSIFSTVVNPRFRTNAGG